MQSLFEFSAAVSFSYVIAAIVILVLLALFAMIVRRVATQGLSSDASRNRGPRLGVVDTYSLDRTRQLVIIRRDDVEHLLMIGGANDILIESNIVRAISASSIRESQTPTTALYDASSSPFEAPSGRPLDNDEPFVAPQPVPAMTHPVQQPPQSSQGPRLKVSPQPIKQQAYALRPQAEHDSPEPIQSQAARDVLSESELQALAKRIEASMPPVSLKPEKPDALQPSVIPTAPAFNPAPAPVPQQVSPSSVTQQPVYVAPPIQSPPSAHPASQTLPPQGQSVAAPIMPQPRAPMMPPATPLQPLTPAPPQFHAPPTQQPARPQAPITALAAQPLPPAEAPQAVVQPVTPKDPQAAMLDENLRRLLGRKIPQQ